jgi:hypothetical protein
MYLDRRHFAAVNAFHFESRFKFNPCGVCATVKTVQGKELQVMFVDDCSSCSISDVLLSEQGIASLHPITEGTTYALRPCTLNDKGVFMSVLDTGTYYARVSFGNLPGPIEMARINNMISTRNHLGHFEFNADLEAGPAPFLIELTFRGGWVLRTKVRFIENQYLFGKWWFHS